MLVPVDPLIPLAVAAQRYKHNEQTAPTKDYQSSLDVIRLTKMMEKLNLYSCSSIKEHFMMIGLQVNFLTWTNIIGRFLARMCDHNQAKPNEIDINATTMTMPKRKEKYILI